MQTPKVSIIVPIYNVEKYLPACLDSLVGQTLREIEIICVDDGSPDNSAAIVQRYMEQDDRIRLIRQENKGLSGARNTGLQYAIGEFVYFMDSDDWLESMAMEKCYQLAEDLHLDFVTFDACSFIDEGYDGKAVAQYDRQYLLKHVANQAINAQSLYQTMLQTGAMSPSVCLLFIRRDVLEKHGLHFEEKLIHEDELFTPQLYMLANRILYLPCLYFHRRVRTGSIMTSSSKERSVMALCHIIEELIGMSWPLQSKRLISWRCHQLMLYADSLQNGYMQQHLPKKIYLTILWQAIVRKYNRKLKKYFAR